MPILEQMAMKKLALNTFDLMVLAGTAVFQILKSNYPSVNKLIILSGAAITLATDISLRRRQNQLEWKWKLFSSAGVKSFPVLQ